MAASIDLVYTWVDGEDPEWQRSKREWMERAGLPPSEADEKVGNRRYANMREIVYAVRAARRYASWVRRIYLVMADDQQVPAALAAHVIVVRHSTIMPADILPTFCSYSIEAFVHRIPGLSEVFLYANDDFLFWKPTPRRYFVDGERLRLRGRFLSRVLVALGDLWQGHTRIATRTAALLNQHGLAVPFLPEHSIHVMRRSTCARVWEVLGHELERAVARRFRDDGCLFWQLLVYSFESAREAPLHTLSFNTNVVTFDDVERSFVARMLVLFHLFLLARYPPH